MPSTRTQRFARLLRMQEQLEKGLEWRHAEARARRQKAESDRDTQLLDIEMERVKLSEMMGTVFSREGIVAALAQEKSALHKLAVQTTLIADLTRAEKEIESTLAAMRIKTKQWEKLHASAEQLDQEKDLQTLQASWDEHGLRSHRA